MNYNLLPDDIENRRQDELIVNSDGHVARLVERRRHRPHGVTQVDRPQQEEELSCEATRERERDVVQHVHTRYKSRCLTEAIQAMCNSCGCILWTINESCM